MRCIDQRSPSLADYRLARTLVWPGWSASCRALRRRRRERRAIAELQARDARLLKDIGIERSEIESIVRGLGSDPSRVDRT